MSVLAGFENSVSKDDCFKAILKRFDEHITYDRCHTISNAMIVVTSLLYGS